MGQCMAYGELSFQYTGCPAYSVLVIIIEPRLIARVENVPQKIKIRLMAMGKELYDPTSTFIKEYNQQ